jgi:hypothetical protein
METSSVLRRIGTFALAGCVLAGAALPAFAGQQQGGAKKEEAPKEAAAPPKGKNAEPTGEQVAEAVIIAFGLRERLQQIRRTGVERGSLTRPTEDGRSEVINYTRSFKRGDSYEKDKIRLDQRKPSLEYSLVFNEGKVFGLLRGTTFTPRQEDVTTFLSDRVHGIDTLLRYKESGSTVKYVSKETQKGLEMWLIDLTDKEKNTTRFFVSSKTWRVLWLEWDETPPGESRPVKFRRTFHDYRVVQGTYVPYRSRFYAGERQLEEAQVLTVTYGVKMEDDIFKTPETASNF